MQLTVKNLNSSSLVLGGRIGRVPAFGTVSIDVTGSELEALRTTLTRMSSVGQITFEVEPNQNTMDDFGELATVEFVLAQSNGGSPSLDGDVVIDEDTESAVVVGIRGRPVEALKDNTSGLLYWEGGEQGSIALKPLGPTISIWTDVFSSVYMPGSAINVAGIVDEPNIHLSKMGTSEFSINQINGTVTVTTSAPGFTVVPFFLPDWIDEGSHVKSMGAGITAGVPGNIAVPTQFAFASGVVSVQFDALVADDYQVSFVISYTAPGVGGPV